MPDAHSIHTVTLRDLESLSAALAERVEQSGFAPDLIVCIEEAARLPALYFNRTMPAPIFPLRIQRPSSRWRRWAAPLAARLPRAVQDWLRGQDARHSFHVRGKRVLAADTPTVNLAGFRIIILDDAADSGSTLILARQWALTAGAAEQHVRTSALTVTTDAGKEVTDYYVMEKHCRFPWSSDSQEAAAYQAQRRALAGEFEARRWRP